MEHYGIFGAIFCIRRAQQCLRYRTHSSNALTMFATNFPRSWIVYGRHKFARKSGMPHNNNKGQGRVNNYCMNNSMVSWVGWLAAFLQLTPNSVICSALRGNIDQTKFCYLKRSEGDKMVQPILVICSAQKDTGT